MRKRSCLVLVGSVLLVGLPAFAKAKPPKEEKAAATEREVREREARKACLEGDATKGVSLLSELFLDFKDATYIFNQGRCFEQNERYQEAIGRFREYLRTGAEDAALARRHITECEELDAKKNPSPPALVAQPAAQPVARTVPVPSVQPSPAVAQPVQEEATASSGAVFRTAGMVVAGVGVAGLVTGFVLNLKANSLAKEISPPNAYDAGKESTRQSYETFSWVGYGVGAAAIATGAVLYGVGLSKGSSDNVALLPTIGPGIAGAAVQGSF